MRMHEWNRNNTRMPLLLLLLLLLWNLGRCRCRDPHIRSRSHSGTKLASNWSRSRAAFSCFIFGSPFYSSSMNQPTECRLRECVCVRALPALGTLKEFVVFIAVIKYHINIRWHRGYLCLLSSLFKWFDIKFAWFIKQRRNYLDIERLCMCV